MSAEVIAFPRPDGSLVELAWATHRAFVRAEAADPALLDDPAHVKARDRAKAEFERLFAEWSKHG